jgi:hypothetical protein
MASVKNINSDYTINCDQDTSSPGTYLGVFTVNAANIILNGSVTNVQPSVTVDAFLTVGANNTGAIGNLGLIAQKTANTYAGLRWNTTANAWQISTAVDSLGDPVANYANIGTSTLAIGGANTQIQFNSSNLLAGSANLTFDAANTVASRLTLRGVNQLGYVGNAQANLAVVANTALVFSNPVSGGGTGLYFISPDPTTPSTPVTDELVSKTKAIIYSIIF